MVPYHGAKFVIWFSVNFVHLRPFGKNFMMYHYIAIEDNQMQTLPFDGTWSAFFGLRCFFGRFNFVMSWLWLLCHCHASMICHLFWLFLWNPDRRWRIAIEWCPGYVVFTQNFAILQQSTLLHISRLKLFAKFVSHQPNDMLTSSVISLIVMPKIFLKLHSSLF